MYQDRVDAGRQLAVRLAAHCYGESVVLAIPRGGVVVAAPIAQRLKTRLEVLITRKIGHPANSEVAVGAVMPDGSTVIDPTAKSILSEEYLAAVAAKEYEEIKRRMTAYQGSSRTPEVAGRVAIIVDDGIATGYTIRAAVKWLRALKPGRIVIAVPVAPVCLVAELRTLVDDVICPSQPKRFMAVGMYYRDFSQTADEEVIALLDEVNGVLLR
ncbi:MAG: phosphoribosyltransferase [Firmicutes bacterium]|nr:phosphoribosyltransferase [Bacillota bacterium]